VYKRHSIQQRHRIPIPIETIRAHPHVCVCVYVGVYYNMGETDHMSAAALVRWRLYTTTVPPLPSTARLPRLRGPQSTYVLFDVFNFQKTENTRIFFPLRQY